MHFHDFNRYTTLRRLGATRILAPEFQNGVEAPQGELFFGRISIKENNYLHQIL